MESLFKTQSATKLVEDINSNLQEMSSQVEVDVTDSATALASTLNTALGVNTLNADDDADTFVAALNTAFENAQDAEPEIVIPGIDHFDKTKFGAEMDDTIAKVNALKDTADMILMVSTDLHHEKPITATIEKDGESYDVPLGDGDTDRSSSFAPLMSNQNEFLRRARQNGINVDAIACLGDFFDGHRTGYSVNGVQVFSAKEIVGEYVGRIMGKFTALSNANNVPLLMAVGNHDDNYDNGTGSISGLTYQDLYNWYLKDTVDVGNPSPMHKYSTTSGVDYYVDFPDAGIRAVVLFDDSSPSSNSWSINKNSLDFLKSCTGSNLPAGYKVLILSHIHPRQSKLYSDYLNMKGSKDGLMTYVEKHSDTIIGYICGHDHFDWVLGYPVASISLVCNKSYNNTQNDIWSVIAIDKTGETISLVRFNKDGRGSWGNKDCKIHYEPIILTQGGSVTLESSIEDVASWEMPNYTDSNSNNTIQSDSWFDVVQSGSQSVRTYYYAQNYASITPSQDLLTCDVTVNAQDTTYPQCVTVRAYSSANRMYEYWFIKIPKTT